VTGQPKIITDLIGAVSQAWIRIQNMHDGAWRFQRVTLTPVALVIGQNVYDVTAAPFSLSDFDRWDTDSFVLYTSGSTDKQSVTYKQYPQWVLDYRLATFTSGRPSAVTDPSASTLRFNALPDVAYLFTGDYRRSVQTLALNTDTPRLPSRHHMAIVWEALRWFAQDRGKDTLYNFAEGMLGKEMSELAARELEIPETQAFEPLVDVRG
jgi:hypothetical protein